MSPFDYKCLYDGVRISLATCTGGCKVLQRSHSLNGGVSTFQLVPPTFDKEFSPLPAGYNYSGHLSNITPGLSFHTEIPTTLWPLLLLLEIWSVKREQSDTFKLL